MAKASLVVMAAGIGSRFGGGIKQLEAMGPSGEIIMDYSIYDAMEAGFDKVVFIIRKDLEKDFKEIIGDRIAKKVEVAYAFQETDDLPGSLKEKFPERTKPWGTGQAILSCKDAVNEPFLVINADDYYGKEAFGKLFDALMANGDGKEDGKPLYFMAGYQLKNTLSPNGTVTRGVCETKDGKLARIRETYEIMSTGTEAEGEADVPGGREKVTMSLDAPVSMNMWGMYPDNIFPVLENGFRVFLEGLEEGNAKSEYLLPMVLGDEIAADRAVIRVEETSDSWFGVTYKEDVAGVKASIRALVDAGAYPESVR